MRGKNRILSLSFLLLGLLIPSSLYAKGWESIKPEKTKGKHVVVEADIEISAGGGMIFVTTTKNVNIQIFSILGSRIADDNLAAGTYQFLVPTHGVYVIKAGDLTCKVAV